MSALIAVNKGHTIELLTDAAATAVRRGTVMSLGSKQISTAVKGCVLTSMGYAEVLSDLPGYMRDYLGGWYPICSGFATKASNRCRTFDELIACANELWAESINILPADAGDDLHAIILTGWSDVRRRLEMWMIDSRENRALDYEGAMAMGPNEDGSLEAFANKFSDDPEAFDAMRDGVPFIEEMRRYPHQFKEATGSCVGGFIEHTLITQSGITSKIIHRWPEDCVGAPIRLREDLAA